MPPAPNILFHQGALGDWVLTFPILHALNGRTLAITARSKARLASKLFPHVVPIDIDEGDLMSLHAEGGAGEVGAVWRDRLSQASRIISFVSRGRDRWAENVHRLAPRAQIVFVDPRPPGDWADHVCDWHRHQLSEQGLELPGADPVRSAAHGGPLLVHPGSGGRDKCWPLERFEALIDTLRARGRQVRVLLGEVESETWPARVLEQWVRQYGTEKVETLDRLHEIMAGAEAFIGNDTGPTHLAAAMGLETIALFGPTSARLWSPRGPSLKVLAPPHPTTDLMWLDLRKVLSACLPGL